MLCGFVGNLQLCLNGPEAPRDSEWTSYLRSPLPHGHAVTIGLVHTVGGGPSPAQRQENDQISAHRGGGERQVRGPSPTSRFIAPSSTSSICSSACHSERLRVATSNERSLIWARRSQKQRCARHFADMARMLGIAEYHLPVSAGSDASSVYSSESFTERVLACTIVCRLASFIVGRFSRSTTMNRLLAGLLVLASGARLHAGRRSRDSARSPVASEGREGQDKAAQRCSDQDDSDRRIDRRLFRQLPVPLQHRAQWLPLRTPQRV